MKTSVLILLVSFLVSSCTYSTADLSSEGGGQVPLLGTNSLDTSANAYGGSGDDAFVSTVALPDGSFLSVGYASSNDGQVTGGHGDYDYWVVKTDATGHLVWQKTYGGSASDKASQMVATPDGGYAIVGISRSTDGDKQGAGPIWLIKIDGNGNIVWQNNFGPPGFVETSASIDNTPDGGLVIVYSSENGQGVGEFTLVATNGTGTAVAGFGQGGTDSFLGNCVKSVADGFIVTGQSFNVAGGIPAGRGGGDIMLEKISTDGHKLWEQAYGGTGTDVGYSLVQTSDQGFLIVGSSGSHDRDIKKNAGDLDWVFCKVDNNGNLQWTNTYGGNSRDEANSICTTSDGNFLVAGYTHSHDGNLSSNHGQNDVFVVKIDPNGTVLSQRLCGGSVDDHAAQILEPIPGHYALAGSTTSHDGDAIGTHAGLDAWLFRF